MSTASVAPMEIADLFEFVDRPQMEGLDWVGVAHVDLGSGYSWREFGVWYSPSARRFFWASDRGCSCDTFYQGLSSPNDFSDGDRAAAIAAANRFCDGDDGDEPRPVESVALSQAIARFDTKGATS